MINNFPENKEILEKLKKLTLERIKVMPSNTEVVIGSDRYSKEDLIEHVNETDDLGKQIMIMHLEFLQDLSSGEIYKDDNINNTSQT